LRKKECLNLPIQEPVENFFLTPQVRADNPARSRRVMPDSTRGHECLSAFENMFERSSAPVLELFGESLRTRNVQNKI
jgi:hypothetical protein